MGGVGYGEGRRGLVQAKGASRAKALRQEVEN